MFCIRQAITIPQSSKEDEERRMQIKEAIARVIAVDKKKSAMASCYEQRSLIDKQEQEELRTRIYPRFLDS